MHGMYQFLEQLRSLTTATEQATQTFATSQAEELFHPQLEALLITWLSNKLPEVVRKRAHNRRPQPSARILLTEFYFTLFPQPDDQAKHLGNIARNPTSTSQNPTDVIINIKTWRTSIQMLMDISGCIRMKQDIRSAFDKLVAPPAKHDDDFSLTKTLCQREAYKAITTTDDDVYVSPKIYYMFNVCLKCPWRRRADHEPLWHISTRCVLMKWNSLLLRLFWMGTEDRSAYFAHQLQDLRQIRQSVETDDTELMDIFHHTVETDLDMAQTSCDLRWAPPTRHAVLNEELADIGLDSEECRPISLAQQEQSMEQPGTIRSLDNLRAEVSLEQDPTSLADRFSRGGLPIIVGQLHGGITMREDSVYAEARQSDEDELDETRNNEAHPRQARRQYDPYNAQGSSPSKPFEGLEQCLSWHQHAWNYVSHACPCHRRRCVNFQFEEPTEPRAVEGYASHRAYPILKPPHTTKQALTRVRDRVQDQDPYYRRDPHSGSAHTERTPGVRRNGHTVRRHHIEPRPYFGHAVWCDGHQTHGIRYGTWALLRGTLNILGQQTSAWPRRARLRRSDGEPAKPGSPQKSRDSGANVMVVPLMRDMKGDKTMCSLVGDNKTQGLIISRLYTETRTYLVVAVENASVLLPPAFLVRVAGYRLAWENVPGKEYFKLHDGYGEPVAVQEDDDLLFLGKNTLWRVGHDMYRFAHRQTGMTWPEIWEQLTGESLTIQAITTTSTDQSVDFVELFNPGNFKEQKSSLVAGGTYDVRVNPAIDLTRNSVRQQVRKDIEKEDPLILLGAPPCTVFSPMQNINQKHPIGEAWEKKKQDGMDLLLFATQCYWDQIERGMFFLHEHPATASSWGLNALQELEAYPGVHVVTADMCRWGMRVRDEIPEDQGQPYLVKKPTKWMTNCKPLAELLSLRCDGTHSHVRLEGGTLTRRAASYPISLVRDILKVVVKVKQLAKTANYPKDPAHVMIPESLQESEHCVQVAYTQNTLQAYDTRTPRAIPWESVVVRRTINRKTGVVMAEDYTEELTEVTISRPFKGHSPKEVLTVFFYWDPERTDHMVNYIACSLDLEMYLSTTSELLNVLLNDSHLVPRSSYRKAIGEGVRTITYGAHTSLAALQKSHKFVTNITTADNHQRVLLLCHKLATLMPRSIPYLCITVVVLTTGEDLAPHRDIQNHRHFRNATISFGKWEGGVLQTYEDDIWVNQDSRDQWVILDARNTFHRVTPVEGDRVSVIYHTPQHLDRLRQDDWDILRDTGFPVDQLWEGGLLKELSDAEDDDCPQEQIMTVRQTTPAFSENELYVAEDLDLDANLVFRPTLQAVLWLSELIATTTLRKETVTKRGPKSDDIVTMRAMHDIVAQAQVVLENESDLVTVIAVMTRILILVISLVVSQVGGSVPYGTGPASILG